MFYGERQTPSFRLPYPADLGDGNRTTRPFMSQQSVCECLRVFHMIAKKDQKVGRYVLSCFFIIHTRASPPSTRITHTLPQHTLVLAVEITRQ